MRVLFIWTDVETCIESGVIHIGVAYLSAALKRTGHETSLVRVLNKIEKDELHRRISEFNPGLIAFSVMTNQFDYCVNLADWIKEKFDLPVLFGGSHPTLAPEETIARKSVDMICRGEGEEALIELVSKLESREDCSNIANLWVKKNGETVKNDIRPISGDIDALPFMDVEVYDLENMFREGGINLHMMAGRGCPYQCTYCCNPAVNRLYRGRGNVVRNRTVGRVLEEVRHHLKNHPRIDYLTFQDETFSLDKKWMLEFCAAYREEIGVPFSVMARVNNLDEEMLQALKNAGCDLLRIGVESGSEWLRENILKRKMTNEQIIDVFDATDRIGIRTWAFAMFGLPHETPEMVEETIALLRRLKPNQVQLSIFYPYPGTELYDECKREGWLTREKSFSYFEKPILNLPTITREQIQHYFNSFRQELVEIGAKKEGTGFYDFISHFDEAQIKTDDDEYVNLTTFFEEYPGRFWLQAHPFSEITYEVELPPRCRLVFDIAMHPGIYDRPGKGVRFEVECNGKKVFSRYIDPKNREKDRGWFHSDLPLKSVGKSRLTFRTKPAPRSNNYYCNAGWGRPHILCENEKE